MQLDGRHARVRNILCENECVTWRGFKNKTQEALLGAEYKDDSGNTVGFNKFDRERFQMVEEFKIYLRENPTKAKLTDPLTWTLEIWDD